MERKTLIIMTILEVLYALYKASDSCWPDRCNRKKENYGTRINMYIYIHHQTLVDQITVIYVNSGYDDIYTCMYIYV
jgi:hypothetical protein